jgi:hypothetical protein
MSQPDTQPELDTKVEPEPFWSDHSNLAVLARYLFKQGYSEDDIIYMLEKPWKYEDEFIIANAEFVDQLLRDRINIRAKELGVELTEPTA